jgi:hypothetical protein
MYISDLRHMHDPALSSLKMEVIRLLLTCDMYKSSLRHIHDPVLSSLKMKGVCLLYFHRRIIRRQRNFRGAIQRQDALWYLIFRGQYIVIYSCNKTKEMH